MNTARQSSGEGEQGHDCGAVRCGSALRRPRRGFITRVLGVALPWMFGIFLALMGATLLGGLIYMCVYVWEQVL